MKNLDNDFKAALVSLADKVGTAKQIKTFRISWENQKELARLTKKLDRTEGWIINQALKKYIKYENYTWVEFARQLQEGHVETYKNKQYKRSRGRFWRIR